MPYFHNTPESLLPRSDSKNPATTCKGITANGRPCRRALASTPGSSPTPSPSCSRGVLAVLQDHNTHLNNVAAFYCWQHKDQAENLNAPNRQETKILPLKEKTSIDTLVDRLGVLEIEEDAVVAQNKNHRRRRKSEAHVVKRDTLPGQWHDMQGPLMTVPEDLTGAVPPAPPVWHGRSNTKASVFCCIRADDDHLPPARRHPSRQIQIQSTAHIVQSSSYRPAMKSQSPSTIQTPGLSTTSQVVAGIPPSISTRPPVHATPRSSGSHTQTLLSLFPSALSPQSTSLLLAELSKPISAADEEGFIYMFWLTPESEASKPDDDVASTILESSPAPASHTRRGNEALRRYASKRLKPSQPQTVLLKIGRAANVHRRLSQWAKQCSYNITLIRYYPYNDAQPGKVGASLPPRKVPHVHRVERLIHIELAEKRVVDHGPCENCGKEHREWFEIEATGNGLRAVDEVIRRWVGWGERQI